MNNRTYETQNYHASSFLPFVTMENSHIRYHVVVLRDYIVATLKSATLPDARVYYKELLVHA